MLYSHSNSHTSIQLKNQYFYSFYYPYFLINIVVLDIALAFITFAQKKYYLFLTNIESGVDGDVR